MNANKNTKLTIGEKINLTLAIIILAISFIKNDKELIYGGISLSLASIVSISLIKFFPYKFKKFEINILQFHIFICIVLGTILNFYTLINEFDFLLHLNFGFVSSIIVLPFISYFSNKSNLNINNLSLTFIIFIIFCFSTTCAALWEIYEFSIDTLFGLNTQNNDLFDTMTDIISTVLGTIVYCIVYFFKNKKRQDN